MKNFTFPIPHLRLGEFDLGGVLYHANYFHLYEMAREELLRTIGLPYAELVKHGQHLAVVESAQQFHLPIRYGMPITVSITAKDLKRTAVTLVYKISSDTTHLHDAFTTHVFVELQTDSFRPARLPKQLHDGFHALLA